MESSAQRIEKKERHTDIQTDKERERRTERERERERERWIKRALCFFGTSYWLAPRSASLDVGYILVDSLSLLFIDEWVDEKARRWLNI